jgi:uncharacterized protein DUF3349
LSRREGPPKYLESELAALRRAYPGGVPPGDYLPVLAVLQEELSARNVALVVGELAGKEPIVVENAAAAAMSVQRVDAAEIHRVKRLIATSGRAFEL